MKTGIQAKWQDFTNWKQNRYNRNGTLLDDTLNEGTGVDDCVY